MSIAVEEARTATVAPWTNDLAFEVIGEVEHDQPEPTSPLCLVGCR
jgi:hypothetical protein